MSVLEKNKLVVFSLAAMLLLSCSSRPEGKHLFILSGQSNMQRLQLQESFTPAIEAAFGKENVISVKDAVGGQPIRRWYRDWRPINGDLPQVKSDLYDSLMLKVNVATANEHIKTVTFIWMQGERDAREKHGDVYEESLIGLYNQLSEDLGRTDVNFLIGRLSDFDMQNVTYPHWTMIRDIQVKVADSDPRFDWINTDDLNDGETSTGKKIKNDLHMSVRGYMIMGDRFANKAISLVNNKQ